MKKFIALLMAVVMLCPVLCLSVYAESNKTLSVTEVIPSEDGYTLSGLKMSAKKSGTRSLRDVLPDSYDSRDYGDTVPVRSQGNTGSCWAFATINSLETYAVINGYETGSDVDFSQSHLVYYTYNLPTDEDDRLCGEGYSSTSPYNVGGNWMRAISTLSEWSGIASLEDFPFYLNNQSAMSSFSEEGRYNHDTGYVLSDAIFLNSADEMKQWIMDNGSCTMGIYYDSSCENTDTDSYYSGQDSSYINHNVSVVGWDDDYSASNFSTDPGSDGAWLIKDSWGEYVHDGGYYWLSYAEPTDYNYCVGYTIRPDTDLYNNYTYCGIGYNGTATLSSGSALANVFKADGYESITSVSFFTEQTDLNCTIEIYTDLPSDYEEPTDGTLAYSASKSVSTMGYHTYSLSSTVDVDKDTYFAVCVTYSTSDDSDILLPVEIIGDYSANGMYITSDEKQSYYYLPGNSGYADAQDSGIGNFWIQAATKCHHQMVTTTVDPTCTEAGTTSSVCSQCGLRGVSSVLPATGHDYGSWSEYTKSGNLMVSTRTCKNCGDQIRKSYRIASENTITIDVLLARFFNYIFARFRRK